MTDLKSMTLEEITAALQLDVQGFHLMPTYENHYLQYVYFG